MNKLEILYEDNHILVVVKPYNVLSQKDDTGDIDMLSMIKNYLKEKYQKPGNVYLGLVHRLDRPVGGIMVFAKTSKAASRLSKEVVNHELKKTYLAIVHGTALKEKDTFIDYLVKRSDNNSYITDSKEGKLSKLDYKVIEKNKKNNLSLVEINLITGRHHQIRVQFSSRGYSLYGDQRYGSSDRKQIALFAYKLEFVHPVKRERMLFIKYPIKNGVWNLFKSVK